MRSRLLTALALAAALGAAAACSDEPRAAAGALGPERPVQGSVAYLATSARAPRAGDTVTVTAAIVSSAEVTGVGAFTAALAFDVAGLEFVRESALPSGMRALNVVAPGQLVAAGASTEGFEGGKLFAATFKVRDPAALQSLALTISELGGTDFGNHVPKLKIERRVFAGRSKL